MNIVIVCVLRKSSEKQFDVEHLQYTIRAVTVQQFGLKMRLSPIWFDL